MLEKGGLKIIDELSQKAIENNRISPEFYNKYSVKRGLRNENGTGVLVGLTEISEVHGYMIDEGEKISDQGRLVYRGIDIKEIAKGFQAEKRFGFEETCFLLLFGELPQKEELIEFKQLLGRYRELPEGFVENMVLKNPSNDIMNKLQRSVLVLYSNDYDPDDLSIKNVLRQSIELIAHFPAIVAYGYQAKEHYFAGKSLYIHAPQPELSTAENVLHMIRPDNQYTQIEAEVLDLALVIHAEHGGGNNSAFATCVVSSSGTDTYSAISTAVGSLKGPKHGGANIKVMEMMQNIKANIKDYNDQNEIRAYMKKILAKEVFDKSGLIYGLGHAIYTLSDPRAELLKIKARDLAETKGRLDEFELYSNIEEIAIQLFKEEKNVDICANVDFYSGFVYDMLNIPVELYTAIFAVARIAGWCAHRIEYLATDSKIIRPAYKCVKGKRLYTPLEER